MPQIVKIPIRVVGLAYHAAPAFFAQIAGPGGLPACPLALRREPDNPHDSSAVEVLAFPPREDPSVIGLGTKIGYIPKENSRDLAELIDEGGRLAAALDDGHAAPDRGVVWTGVLESPRSVPGFRGRPQAGGILPPFQGGRCRPRARGHDWTMLDTWI